MRQHFISDLHLDDAKPAITEILLEYLRTKAKEADELYLLGDIFEYWLGDDISQPKYSSVCDELRRLSDEGVKLYFMRGNRDFLVSDEFSHTTGCEILNDPQIIDIAGQRTLISHGDLLCSEDLEHQHFRGLVSQPEVRERLLSLPAEQRVVMAQQIRGMSKSGNSLKPADIMDVTQATVEEVMREHKVDLLMHGHTHRCATHDFTLDGRAVERVVLADWNETSGSVLICEDGQRRFESLSV